MPSTSSSLSIGTFVVSGLSRHDSRAFVVWRYRLIGRNDCLIGNSLIDELGCSAEQTAKQTAERGIKYRSVALVAASGLYQRRQLRLDCRNTPLCPRGQLVKRQRIPYRSRDSTPISRPAAVQWIWQSFTGIPRRKTQFNWMKVGAELDHMLYTLFLRSFWSIAIQLARFVTATAMGRCGVI